MGTVLDYGKKRLQRAGPYSVAIIIPQSWTKAKRLRHNDCVSLSLDSEGRLVIDVVPEDAS